jgi:hypothetical protein
MHKAINLSTYKTLSQKKKQKINYNSYSYDFKVFQGGKKVWVIRAREGCT